MQLERNRSFSLGPGKKIGGIVNNGEFYIYFFKYFNEKEKESEGEERNYKRSPRIMNRAIGQLSEMVFGEHFSGNSSSEHIITKMVCERIVLIKHLCLQ